MTEGKTLKQLNIEDWAKKEISKDCLLLHKDIYPPEQDCDGFDFCCVNFVSQECKTDAPVEYEILFEGTAYFDGVRHLYFGSEKTENYGYLYYSDVPLLFKALQALDALQVSKCRYVADERAKP